MLQLIKKADFKLNTEELLTNILNELAKIDTLIEETSNKEGSITKHPNEYKH